MMKQASVWLAPVFFLCSIAASMTLAHAQQMPASHGQAYQGFRQEMLAGGWRPDTGFGLKIATGKPLYKYPEVVCGPKLCLAKWRDRQGKPATVTLVRGYDSVDHRLAE